MNYKSVIEEQIRELQKIQDKIIKGEYPAADVPSEVRRNAETIARLATMIDE